PPGQRQAAPVVKNTSTSVMALRPCWPRWTCTVAESSRPPTSTATPRPTSSPSSTILTRACPPTCRCTWCSTTVPRTSPTQPAGGSLTTPASTLTTRQPTPCG